MRALFLYCCAILLMLPGMSAAQEHTGPMPHRSADAASASAAKPTVLSLPFFEDFTGSAPFPDPIRWSGGGGAFVGNTMASGVFSRGVVTFDANNLWQVPYDTVDAFHQVSADTLASLAIDLSSHTAADSVWLSFYYQPKGRGFLPKPDDSLLLFFLQQDGYWAPVWATGGDTTTTQFSRVMIPVKDPVFFHSGFRIRFVNKATWGVSNSQWHLDYLLLNEGRNYQDTLIRDVAFTDPPSFLLQDFTAMPYRHFITDPSAFWADSMFARVANNGLASLNLAVTYQAEVVQNGAAVGTGSVGLFLPGSGQASVGFPAMPVSGLPPIPADGKVTIETTYVTTPGYPNEPEGNDTIIATQKFDNYFAYDDGSAEQVYFLNLNPSGSVPGKIAVEYALYADDTVRGVSVLLPRTAPSSADKEFSLAIYRDIAIDGGADQLVYQQDFYYPRYSDTVNQLTDYAFEDPVVLPPGRFFVVLIQPAGGFSDSLYVGLDKNRGGGNHRYFNVDGSWQPSLLDGALLLRPLVGPKLPPSAIDNPDAVASDWNLAPNPAVDRVRFSITGAVWPADATYEISDLNGRPILTGSLKQSDWVSLSRLSAGVYFVRIHAPGKPYRVKKLIKR